MESDLEITNEFLCDLSDFITQNDIRLLNKKMDNYDIVNLFLENNQSEDPFFIVNLGEIIRQYKKWIYYLPNIKPYYAIKCNPDPLILKVLNNLGCNFDCASKNEIAKVIDLGVSPNRIIFANPCKMSSQIKFARAHDVDLLIFDSEHELYKIINYHPEANLVLRIKTDDTNSLCKFSCKFGADLEEVDSILKKAQAIGKRFENIDLNVIGVSFHVGSSCMSVDSYISAIIDSRKVFDIAKSMGFDMYLLDIGGGFPGVDNDKFHLKLLLKKLMKLLFPILIISII